MKLRFLLLDLDGTLLPMDTDEFFKAYLKLLSQSLAPYIAPTEFIPALMASTAAMVHDLDPSRTNRDVFMKDFFERTALRKSEIEPIFDGFYSNEFGFLIRNTKPSPVARLIVDEALTNGLELVIATNPLFPLSAVRERMRWAGVAHASFRLVTAYEDMHFCKPYPHYFEEILRYLDARPEECLMVGNDVDEDLVAGQVGIKTFLVEDCLICRQGDHAVADYRGSLDDLLLFVRDKKWAERT